MLDRDFATSGESWVILDRYFFLVLFLLVIRVQDLSSRNFKGFGGEKTIEFMEMFNVFH
jgi:hypothetical protein